MVMARAPSPGACSGARQQHLAHKDLRALGDVEDDVHPRFRVGRVGLLGHVDLHLLEAAAQVVGQERIAVAGQVRGESNWPGVVLSSGVSFARVHLVFRLPRSAPSLTFCCAFVDAVGDGERSGSCPFRERGGRREGRGCRVRALSPATSACWSPA
jgi:hypothetical protein